MIDFLIFNTFISQKVLVIFYYFFALFIPVGFVYFRNYLKKYPFFNKIYKNLDKTEKIWVMLVIIFIFLMFELFLRMFFEMMIGYFDMHDYLHKLTEIK
jgi:F0F1-type ATP synthase assembly protein I